MNCKKLIIACSLAFMFAVMSAGSESRCCANAGPATMPTPADKPVFTAYRGVEIGMSADDARKKLKNIKDKSDTQETFQFSDNESADVYYDADHKVRAVSITLPGSSMPPPRPGSFSVRTPRQNQMVEYLRWNGIPRPDFGSHIQERVVTIR